MKKMCLIGILGISILFSSCVSISEGAFEADSFEAFFNGDNVTDGKKVVTCEKAPDSLKDEVYEVAQKYIKENTTYKSGATGKDGQFDCSGFVIRCYYDATRGTEYKLPFVFGKSGHPSASNIYNNYCTKTDKPERGDLLFIDFARNGTVNHVCIYDCCKNGKIYFIDSTDYYKKAVDHRSIDQDDSRVVGFGEMKITKK